jgi:DNA-binding NarL/FixJ family response regulator
MTSMEEALTGGPPGPEGAPIRLVVVDDHALFRKGIGQLLSMYGEIQVVAEAASGAEGIEAVLTHRPDVALVDLHMKGLDGISVVRALQSAGSATRLVMLTVSDSSFDVMEALKAARWRRGARCWRPKSAASSPSPSPPATRASTPAGHP